MDTLMFEGPRTSWTPRPAGESFSCGPCFKVWPNLVTSISQPQTRAAEGLNVWQ